MFPRNERDHSGHRGQGRRALLGFDAGRRRGGRRIGRGVGRRVKEQQLRRSPSGTTNACHPRTGWQAFDLRWRWDLNPRTGVTRHTLSSGEHRRP
jgi:hypothetical protein